MQREAFADTGRAGTSLVDQWLRLRLPIEGVPVPSLVGELGSHMSPGQKNETQNRSNLVMNSVKTSKLVHIKLSLKKKKKARVDKLNDINTHSTLSTDAGSRFNNYVIKKHIPMP